MITEKEKLEEELKLLMESLDLQVISEEEYQTAKSRVDDKLKELDPSEEKKENGIKEEPENKKEEQKIEIKELREEDIEKKPIKEEIKETVKNEEKLEEPKKEEIIKQGDEKPKEDEIKEEDTITFDLSWLKNIFRRKEHVAEEKPKGEIGEKPEEQKILDDVKEETRVKEEVKDSGENLVDEVKDKEVKVEEAKPEEVKKVEVKEEVKVEQKRADEEIKVTEEVKEEEIKVEVKEEKVEEGKPKEEVEDEEPIKKEGIVDEVIKTNKKLYAYVAVILILVVGSWYFYYSGSNDVIIQDSPTDIPTGDVVNLIACSSDNECKKEGTIGICNNPGQEDAKCEYIEDPEIKLTILNSDNCFNCGTARILSILESFYPNINVDNIDIETSEGKEIKEKYDLNALPAYIFDSNFKDAYNYDKLSSSFKELDGNFVMKNTVANANYYLEREEILNKLDIFLKPGEASSSKAEENLKEFLEIFDENVNFEKHDDDSEIVKELGINTFPAFLINNRIKFGGVQPADKIRENFCQVNSVTPCALGLSKSLV